MEIEAYEQHLNAPSQYRLGEARDAPAATRGEKSSV